MVQTLTGLIADRNVQFPDGIAVSYFNNAEWYNLTWPDFRTCINLVVENLQEVSRNKIGNNRQTGCYIGLDLDVTHSFPCLVLGILELKNAFVCLDPFRSSSANERLLNKLKITYILCNKGKAFALRNKCVFERNFTVFGEEISIWFTGLGTESDNAWDVAMAYAVQTSGSTGSPKIVQVPHQSVVPNILHLSTLFRISSEDTIFLGSPPTFDPSVVELFLALCNGATICIVEKSIKQDVHRLLDVIFPLNGKGVTFLQTTPSLFKRWNIREIQGRIFRPNTSLRLLILGGEPFPEKEIVNSWKVPGHVQVYNIYGITEVSCWASLCLLTQDQTAVPIGIPLLETKLSLENCRDSVGEMYIGSETRICVVNDEKYSELVNRKPIFRSTGDLFEVRAGQCYYVGRKDCTVKRWGWKVNLEEIETAALLYPRVSNCAAICENRDGFSRVVLFIVINGELDFVRFRTYLQENLSAGSMPDLIETIGHLPLTPHGKVDRCDLKTMVSVHVEENPSIYLISLWRRYTLCQNPKLGDKFLSSGGNSFGALQLIADLESTYGSVPESLLAILLQNSTLKECFNAVASHQQYITLLSDQIFFDVMEQIKDDSIEDSDIHKSNVLESIFHCTVSEHSSSVDKGGEEEDEISDKSYSSVVCVKGKGRVEAVDTNFMESIRIRDYNIEESWKYCLDKCIDASPIGVKFKTGESVVIVASHSGRIAVIDIGLTSILSESKLQDRIESSACISKCGQYYFIGCYDGGMYKLNLQKSEIQWCYKTKEMIKSTAIIFEECVIFGSYDRSVYCVNSESGTLKWKTEVGGAVLATPLRVSKTIFVATLFGSLVALKGNSGEILWERNLPPVFSSPVDVDGSVVVADVAGQLHWFTPSGDRILSYRAGGTVFSSLSVCSSQNTSYILFGCEDCNVYCLQGHSLAWKARLDSKIVSSSFPIMSDSETILSVSTKGTVYALNFLNGSILARYSLPGEVFSSPIFLENNIVLGCRDNNVYFLQFTRSVTLYDNK